MARHEDRGHDGWLAPALAGGLTNPVTRTVAGHEPARLVTLAKAAFVALLAAVLLVPASSAGAAKSPEDFSAADQYVETLPTSSGPSATKEGKNRRTRLPAGVKAKLEAEGGQDAASLEEVATSGRFGAPHVKGATAGKNRDSSRSTTAVPTASVKAVQDSGEDLLWLLFALIAITGLMVGAVAYQRHKNSKSG
jgi:hypothetical protein